MTIDFLDRTNTILDPLHVEETSSNKQPSPSLRQRRNMYAVPQNAAFVARAATVSDDPSDSSSSSSRQRNEQDDDIISTIEKNLYRDYSQVTPEELESASGAALRRAEGTFPAKLHQMVSDPEAEGVLAWLPHGRAWKILDANRLDRSELLLRYFSHDRITSFMRQVNGWGFRRVTHGVDASAYYHQLFLRGIPRLCARMTRSNKSGGGCSIYSQLQGVTPDFYRISEQYPVPPLLPQGRRGATPDNAPSSADATERSAIHIGLGAERAGVQWRKFATDQYEQDAHAVPVWRAPSPMGVVSNSSLATAVLQEYILHNVIEHQQRESQQAEWGGAALSSGGEIFLRRLRERSELIDNLRSIMYEG